MISKGAPRKNRERTYPFSSDLFFPRKLFEMSDHSSTHNRQQIDAISSVIRVLPHPQTSCMSHGPDFPVVHIELRPEILVPAGAGLHFRKNEHRIHGIKRENIDLIPRP